MRTLLLLSLAACSADATMVRPPPGPGNIDLVAPAQVTAGDVVQFSVTGATPGTTVFLGASVRGYGNGVCPPLLGGLCLDILQPILVGTTTANASGEATFGVSLPRGMRAGDVWLQAAMADGTASATSNGAQMSVAASVDDADRDALSDAAEARLGTDPHNPDTDGDGYQDGDEVAEGADPLDASSRIYDGGWPYNREKDALSDPGFGGFVTVGERIPRFTAVDQYGDVVDVYDFAGAGRPVMIHLDAIWNPFSADWAEWLGGAPVQAASGHIPPAIAAGDVLWVTVLVHGTFPFTPPTAAEVAAWWNPSTFAPEVTALGVSDRSVEQWASVGDYPSFIYLDDQLVVQSGPGYTEVIDDLVASELFP